MVFLRHLFALDAQGWGISAQQQVIGSVSAYRCIQMADTGVALQETTVEEPVLYEDEYILACSMTRPVLVYLQGPLNLSALPRCICPLPTTLGKSEHASLPRCRPDTPQEHKWQAGFSAPRA